MSHTQYLANPLLRLFLGAIFISFSAVWVRLASVSPSTSGFYRLAIGGVALLLVLLVTRRRLTLSKRAWQLLAAGVVFFALDIWFFHASVVVVGPGLATLLSNFQVFFMMLAGLLLLGQRPSLLQLIAVPAALFGLGMIVGFDWSALATDYRTGVILGLLAALFYAAYMLVMRSARRDSTDPLPVSEVAVVSIGSAVILGIITIAEGNSLVIPSASDATWLISYGIFSQCLGLLLIASSLRMVTTTQAGIALLLQPALSFVWDVLFFDRPMSAIELSGAVITLLAIYMGSRGSSKQTQRAA
ncbi:MAG: DMT family transporter [Woeseiaceae bacterium]